MEARVRWQASRRQGIARLVLTGWMLVALGAARPVWAAESDPYYAWRAPPPDCTASLNAAIQRRMQRALDDVNQRPLLRPRDCADVARALLQPFLGTTMWYFVGAMRGLGLKPSPATHTETRARYLPVGLYRHSVPWRWGFMVPPDPTVYAGDVLFSPDKLGHFFFEGWQYYEDWRRAKAAGHSDQRAHELAIWGGIRDESHLQGDFISGIFSYADLEANEQGFRFFRSLCNDPAPQLVRREGRWQLRTPFDIRAWVNPCWDEAFEPSAFAPPVGRGVTRSLQDLCPPRHRPSIAALFERYRARGCESFSWYYLHALEERGLVPDARPYRLDALCTQGAPAQRGDAAR